MANEITVTVSLTASKSPPMSSALSRAVTGLLRNMGSNGAIANEMSVPTSATVVPAGNVSSPYYAFFYNSDTTNYVTLFNGASGAVFARLRAGDVALVPLDPTVTLYAQSNTAACQLEYLILSQ